MGGISKMIIAIGDSISKIISSFNCNCKSSCMSSECMNNKVIPGSSEGRDMNKPKAEIPQPIESIQGIPISEFKLN